jgi:hypothetical protein
MSDNKNNAKHEYVNGKFKISVGYDRYDRFSGYQISICLNGFQSTVSSVNNIEQLKQLHKLIGGYIEQEESLKEPNYKYISKTLIDDHSARNGERLKDMEEIIREMQISNDVSNEVARLSVFSPEQANTII